MKRTIFFGVMAVLGAVNIAACSTGDDGSGGDEQDIAIDRRTEDPARILPANFETRLTALITPADVGKSFGLDDNHVPYPDTYWPFRFVDEKNKVIANNGIDDRWQGKDVPSPLEKFMTAFDPSKADDARLWEKKNHGEDVPEVANWFGHCPGWTAAAMFNDPLTKGVSAKLGSSGEIVACTKGSAGCTTFEIGDINALEAEVWLSSEGAFLGARCDTKPKDIKRDKNGRILTEGCRGLNSGALLIILANKMKNVKNAPGFKPHAIAIDAQNEFNTDQIWNQPAYKYEVNEAKALTEAEAIALTHKGKTNLPKKYEFNNDAKGFYKVDIGIKWVQENGPNLQPVSGLRSTKTMRFSAVIELDGDPNSPASKIIGGEFLDDPATGANRLTVPPFVWSADGLASDADARNHNPFVKGSLVQQLVKLALK